MSSHGMEAPVGADLRAERLSLGYDKGPTVVSGLDVDIPRGRVTSIVGANGCGKSTLLRGLARLLSPREGAVVLDGESIHSQKTKEVAKKVGLLPQGPVVPGGLVVEDLVARGRYPHQSLFKQWSKADEAAVEHALAVTETDELRERPVDELSGGQRQRVWIALALAQETPILLLDEPTTFLDLAHQLEVLGLLAALNRDEGRTIVLVLHDINQAARYSHHIIAMSKGRILVRGAPADVITEPIIAKVFGVSCVVIEDPVSGTPLCVPRAELHPAVAVPSRPDLDMRGFPDGR
jgi:iron complex transport system ATP-binding protein